MAFIVPTYPLVTIIAMVTVVGIDVGVLKTRLVTTRQFWISFAIMVFFQVFIDGWLTRSLDPVVIYNEADISGIRVFWNTPIEDFGFGFALILLTLSVWKKLP